MTKLSKSLADLDAAADELLAKSQAAEGDNKEEDVTPEEVSDNSATPEESSEEGAEEDKEGKEEDVKKSDEPENLEDGDDGDGAAEENGEGEEEPTPEEVEKSMKEDFLANDIIAKSIEGSEFLSACIEVLSKSLSDVQYDQQVASKNASASNDVIAKSMIAVMASNQKLQADNERLTRRINKLEKSMSQGFDKVMDSLDTISSQPAHMRKSMASVNVHDRNFGASLDGTAAVGGFESLSKSQVMTVLNNELYSGNPNVTPQDIISYESGAPLRTDLQTLVASKTK